MFVRTENGIYETIKCLGDGSCYCNNGNKNKYISSFEILKQSDTIEELCDGFYNDILGDGYFNFDSLYIYNDFESFKDDWLGYRTHDNWEGDGYGFIKTSKGLIYVAKMNSKGELELI